MRSYVLAGNTAHYDAVIRALAAVDVPDERAYLDTVGVPAFGMGQESAVERIGPIQGFNANRLFTAT